MSTEKSDTDTGSTPPVPSHAGRLRRFMVEHTVLILACLLALGIAAQMGVS